MKKEVDARNFDIWLAATRDCRRIVFQALDLRPHDEKLAALPQARTPAEACVFLGCKLGVALSEAATKHHGVVFPDLGGRPYQPFRNRLYTVDELFAGYDPSDPASYRATPDWQTYVSYIQVGADHQPKKPIRLANTDLDEVLARRLHDHFVTDELDEELEAFSPKNGGRGVVAIMGGHDRPRSDAAFLEIARLSRQLTLDGYLVVSGGGPGLMEAANLGAYLAARPETDLTVAIAELARAAETYKDPRWLSAAWQLRTAYAPADPKKHPSAGIPTWFYGHEPPNVFATYIAKYFENSLREEGLLAIATHGVIFAEGNAGTTQEIFQDATQNYYENYGHRSPMILFGTKAWNPAPEDLSDDPLDPRFLNKPAWPLLRKLARIKGFEHLLTSTDSADEALEAIRRFQAPPG